MERNSGAEGFERRPSAAAPAQAQKIPAEKLKKMSVVPCYGINSCNAKGQCSGMGHECAGQNPCKGQGWLAIPKEACLAIEGGSLTPLKKG